MTPEQERWAEAMAVERIYGARAADHIASRVAALAHTGDQAGVIRWRQIATRFDALQGESYAGAIPAAAGPTSAGSPRE